MDATSYDQHVTMARNVTTPRVLRETQRDDVTFAVRSTHMASRTTLTQANTTLADIKFQSAHAGFCAHHGATTAASSPSLRSERRAGRSPSRRTDDATPNLTRSSSSRNSLRSLAHSPSWQSLSLSSSGSTRGFGRVHGGADSLRFGCWDRSFANIEPRTPWNSHSHGSVCAWEMGVEQCVAGKADERLRLHLGNRPIAVVTAPGTRRSTFQRPANFGMPNEGPLAANAVLPPPRPKRSRSPRARRPRPWNDRFVVAFAIDNNPTIDGTRMGLNNRVGTVSYLGASTRSWERR